MAGNEEDSKLANAFQWDCSPLNTGWGVEGEGGGWGV